MYQLFLAIAFDLESDRGNQDHGGNGYEGDKQDEGDENVSALGLARDGVRLSHVGTLADLASDFITSRVKECRD
jgi:hypothetical protein